MSSLQIRELAYAALFLAIAMDRAGLALSSQADR